MNQLSDYEQKALQKLGETIMEGKWSNTGLVQLIALVEQFLNPLSIQKYADQEGKTYNGIKKTKKTVLILGHKYIIDNE
jgi:hypothetical protein